METALASALGKALWKFLQAEDIDAEQLFRKYGLDPSLIQNPRSRYPFETVCQAWLEASGINGDIHAGLQAGVYYNPLDLQALGVAFLCSGNLLEAFQRLQRYVRILNSYLNFEIIEEEGRVVLASNTLDMDDPILKIVEDGRMSVVLDLARRGLEQSVTPVEVAFSYKRPANIEGLVGLFDCPLKFSTSTPSIAFEMSDAIRPFSNANRELARGNDQILDSLIKDLKSSGLVTDVKKMVIEDLPSGTPTEAQIAKKLFMSGRTLQRRLADDGTSFRDILLDVRRDLAERYIADKNVPLAEIGYMLGFSDTSSFSRAFKGWTGKPPNAYRQALG